jgi:6-phosphogluconolactonase
MSHKMVRLIQTAVFLSFFAKWAGPALAADVVYVSVAGEKRIAIYDMDGQGRLTHKGDASTSGEPGALAIDPKGRYLFAALRSTGELAAFRVDSGTGKLTHLNTVPAGADPAQLSINRTGKFLLTAYYVAGKVTVHQIGADGKLSEKPRHVYKTREKAHAVVFSPREWAVLIPHAGPNVIYVLRWREETGELAKPFFGAEFFETPKSTGPRHLVFHPTLVIPGGFDLDAQVAYVANEQGSSVTLYHAVLNPINWGLSPKQTLSTLPADFKGKNACAEIRLHPSNRFLYVSNRGHDSIAGFRINHETGELTSLGQTATEKTPRSFDLDPSGKFLFAAGEASGKLAAYRVNEASGALKRIATYAVGRTPWWVMAVSLPKKDKATSDEKEAGQEQIDIPPPQKQPEHVPLLRLLVHPKRYHGKYIQVIGYLHLQFEGNGLWLHKEDFDHAIMENTVWVDVTPRMEKNLKEIQDKYVIMRGVFDAKRHGHLGVFSGTLTKIDRCEVWSDPKKPVRSK